MQERFEISDLDSPEVRECVLNLLNDYTPEELKAITNVVGRNNREAYPRPVVDAVNSRVMDCFREIGLFREEIDKFRYSLKEIKKELEKLGGLRKATELDKNMQLTKDQWRVVDGFSARLRNLEKRAGYDI